jgi:hypothetical protein
MRKYASFAEFYPFYLSEHANRTCRRLHFVGTTVGLVCLGAAVATGNAGWVLVGLVAGYFFAWAGASHVCVLPLGPTGDRTPDRRVLEALAPAG